LQALLGTLLGFAFHGVRNLCGDNCFAIGYSTVD